MDNTLFLQTLCDLQLEEGKAYLQDHSAELTNYAAIGNLLADEALAKLYIPFLSLKLAELLIFFGDRTHHLFSHALGLKAKGDALVQIGHHQAALECLDAAGAEFLHLEDEGNWARSRISWIAASASLGKVEEALEAATSARDVFLRQGETYWVCIVDSNRAWVYDQIGRYQEALRLYKQMLTIYPTLRDQNETFIKRAIAIAEVNQAIDLTQLGKFEQAYRLQQKAQASFSELAENSLIISSEIELADLDYTQGYYGSALRRYYRALDTSVQNNINDPLLLTEVKLWMAHCLVKLNRAQEACALADEAVAVCRQLGTSLQASNALREYAITLVASGRLQEALAALNEASVLFSQGGFEHHASATKLQQAELLLEMGNVIEAYDQARSIKEYFDAQSLVARSVRASLIMVGSLIEQIQQFKTDQEEKQRITMLAQAMELGKQVAFQAHRHHLQEEVHKSQHFLGRLCAFQGDMAKATRHYGAAIAQIERILDDLVYDLSPSFLHTTWTVYEDMIALCLQRGQAETAFNYLERARSMALRQYLYKSKMNVDAKEAQAGSVSVPTSQTNNALLLRTQHELTAWQDKYRHYSGLLAQIDTSVSPAVEQSIIKAELKRCETKLSELFERLYLQQATTHSVSQRKRNAKHRSKQLHVAQLRQHLFHNQVLLAYFLHKEKLVIFATTSEHITTHEIPDGAKQLKRLLPLLHAHLQLGGKSNQHQLSQQQAILAMLHKLYNLLIAPVAALLPPASGYLTIVPYGPLHNLPFHALHDGSHFLIENFQINYLPASSLLNPSPKDDPGVAFQAPLIFGYSAHGHLQRALEEAKTLDNMLNGRCYLEDEATIARLIKEAPGSPIIHLATHGHCRLDAPNFSAVLLADGRFNAIDAFSLDLQKCELVTLSGCETGLALSGGGDEQLGLGRAFLAAGTSSLVMSLWPVEDNATGELMQKFYQHLLQGESKVEALRNAQCSLIQQPEAMYSHPYYWAAFRLVGDISPIKYAGTQKERLEALWHVQTPGEQSPA
ncbi:MAG: CHAT domain-containing protein [Ktedonobacteraceae bacterium]